MMTEDTYYLNVVKCETTYTVITDDTFHQHSKGPNEIKDDSSAINSSSIV